MNQEQINSMIESLIRSGPRRDVLYGKDHLSDENLIRQIMGRNIPLQRLKFLVSLSRLLRLMDSVIMEHETGDSFVSKFSAGWLSLQGWETDPIFEAEFDNLNKYYSKIQLFSASLDARQEEPLLFGIDELKEFTRTIYERLKEKWYLSLSGKNILKTDEH